MIKGYLTVASMAFGAALLATTSAFAQAKNEDAPRPTPPANRTTTTTIPAQGEKRPITLDERTLAAGVAICNQAEVAIATFAKDKVKNEEVKELAEMLIKDHQALLQKLQKFTPEASRANWLTQSEGDAPNKTTAGVVRAGGAREATTNAIQQTAGTQSQGQGVDVLQLQREVAQQCLASAKKKLAEYEGAEMDQCFLGMQAGAHMHMHDQLTVLQKHTSGEFKQLLAEASKSTAVHLEKIEALMKDIKSDSKKE